MNLDQMEFRCPDAEVIGNVVVKDYRLVFRGNSRGNGVASICRSKGNRYRVCYGVLQKNAKKAWITMKDIHIYMENRIFLCSVKMGRNFMQLYIL